MGKLDEARKILSDLKLPRQQQNDRSAYTLLALLDLKEKDKWVKANNQLIRIHDIMVFIKENYGVTYAENSRETFRRQTIHQFEQAGLVERNKDEPTRPTNSGKTVYSVTPEALNIMKKFGEKSWDSEIEKFLNVNTSLAEKYSHYRVIHRVAVDIGDLEITMSAGEHNVLQKAIIEEFGARFAKGAVLLYLGDTADKQLFVKEEELKSLGIPMTKHDKLPDVVMYLPENNWLYLCEAVTSHGPMSPKRIAELEEMLKDCACGKIYISAFPDRQTYKKYFDEIAWETEVWISDQPDHLIHMNGDKFIGPHKK